MGSWSVSVSGDDTVMDIVSTYSDALKFTQSFDSAKEKVLIEYSELLKDGDEAHLVWLALGHAQWKYNMVQDDVLFEITNIIENETGLELFAEESAKCLAARKKVLLAFLKKLKDPNPKPNKIPKVRKAKVLFSSGDCISIKRENSGYLAGIVIWTDLNDTENPLYLISILDWSGKTQPTNDVFESCVTLKVEDTLFGGMRDATMGYINSRFSKFKDKIVVVANLQNKIEEGAKSSFVSPWEMIGDDYDYSKSGI